MDGNGKLWKFLRAAQKQKPTGKLSRAAWNLAAQVSREAGQDELDAETLRGILVAGAREVYGEPDSFTPSFPVHRLWYRAREVSALCDQAWNSLTMIPGAVTCPDCRVHPAFRYDDGNSNVSSTSLSPAGALRLLLLPLTGREEPYELDAGEWQLNLVPGWEQALHRRASEVAPGVRVALLGTGPTVLPGGKVRSGARIAVWHEPGSDSNTSSSGRIPGVAYPSPASGAGVGFGRRDD